MEANQSVHRVIDTETTMYIFSPINISPRFSLCIEREFLLVCACMISIMAMADEQQQQPELKLLGEFLSPYAVRVKLALGIKKLSYDDVEEDLSNKSQLLLESNPVHKKIPVLIHAGRSICESQIIVQYIDAAWPDAGRRILPSDPYEQAISRFWGAYVDDKLFPSFLLALKRKEDADVRQTLLSCLKQLEEEGFRKISPAAEGFFAGESLGYVDIVLGPFVLWLEALEKVDGVEIIHGAGTPALSEWARRFSGEDAVVAVSPEVGAVMECIKELRALWAAGKPAPW